MNIQFQRRGWGPDPPEVCSSLLNLKGAESIELSSTIRPLSTGEEKQALGVGFSLTITYNITWTRRVSFVLLIFRVNFIL